MRLVPVVWNRGVKKKKKKTQGPKACQPGKPPGPLTCLAKSSMGGRLVGNLLGLLGFCLTYSVQWRDLATSDTLILLSSRRLSKESRISFSCLSFPNR